MFVHIGVFYLLTFFFTILIGGLQQEAGLLPQLTFLPQWGPGLAGLLTVLIFRKSVEKIPFFDAKMPALQYLWLLLAPLGVGLLAYAAGVMLYPGVNGLPFSLPVLGGMLLGALGEEIGWRGFLQRYAAGRMSGFWAAVISAVLWTFFHMPYWAGGPLFLAAFALALVSFSLLMHALLAEYRFNVLGATIFHLGINLTSALFASLVLSFNLGFMLVYSLIAAVCALIVVVRYREHFSLVATKFAS